MTLRGRVALVTGASRGIGRAVALALGRRGASVVVNYRDHEAGARETCRALEAMGAGALPFRADVTRREEVAAMVEAARVRWGGVHILVNNAGVGLYRLFLDTSPEEWEKVMAVHLGGAYHCSRAVLPLMIRAGWGRIINVASIWGLVGGAGEVAYSTAKAGLIGFTKALAREVGGAGITVNAVAPGAIATRMLDGLNEDERADLARRTPAGRLGTPEDVAEVVAFLASDAAAFITGQVISPNGGLVT